MKLTPLIEKFILHWGEMGTRWGINRTVAQIHALLFISPRPLNAEEIAETLGVARSNVSNSLRELQGWGIVKVVHIMGDRRDHFETMKDVWEMLRTVLEERKKREIDPTAAFLRECVSEAGKGGSSDSHTKERLKELSDFFESLISVYEQISQIQTPALLRVARMGERVRKVLEAPLR
ncbi:MarR family transcriptional regulator [bacterium]|nr:MarR family transcriptional regulator [bacterium]